MKHVFIIDPKLFNGLQWKVESLLDSIGQYFRTQEKPDFSTLFSHYPRDAMGLIQKQMSEAEEFDTIRVYAVGGDDILFDCLNGIAELPNTELAIMPHGNTNNFIRSFGDKKTDLFKDVHALAEAPTVPTDMIKVGNTCAINGCAVGLPPAIAMKRKRIESKFEGNLNRFFMSFLFFFDQLASLFDKELIAQQYKVTIDGEDYSGHYSLINIVNGSYFGRAKTALAGAMPDDGLLDVILFRAVTPMLATRAIRKYSRGRKLSSSCVRIQAKKIEIRSDKPMWIQTDSEFLQDTSITFEVVPGTVQVVAVNNLTYQGF